MPKIKLLSFSLGFGIFLLFSLVPTICHAMSPGTLLYRTSGNGKMYGYSGDPLIYSEKGILKNVYSGHVAMYIGQEDGVDYIVEASTEGIVKTPAKYFVNLAEGEKFLGAKLPKDLTPMQTAKAVLIAKSLVGQKLGYDFDFKVQKGPSSGDWTCVGLTEKIYESANISNPNNLKALEYDPNYYAVNITSDGFDNYSVINDDGDCFSRDYEFSKISRKTDLLVPAPELIGYDAGLEYNGDRYIFLPYTQFLQPTLKDASVDITVASDFNGLAVRGAVPTNSLVLRWSLINNPLSSLAAVAQKVKGAVTNLIAQIFPGNNDSAIVLDDSGSSVIATRTAKTVKNTTKKASTKVTAKIAVKSQVSVKKAKTMTATAEKTTTMNGSEIVSSPSNSSKKTADAIVKSGSTTIKIASQPKVNKVSTVLNSTPTNQSTVVTVAAAPVSSSGSSNNVTLSTYNPNTTETSLATDEAATTSKTTVESGEAITTEVTTPSLALINKVYATGDNDWVELSNPTDHDFDLATAGYRLEKTKTAEDPALIIRLGNAADGSYPSGTMIKAHGTYLIVRDEANDYYKNKADAIATRDDFGWTGHGYTLYLGTDAISSSTDQDIVDAVGFGADATYYSGSGSASEITDNHILSRVANSGNNQSDYALTPTDDPSATTTETTGTATTTTTSTSTATTDDINYSDNSYFPVAPIESEGLVHLWHFDECSGLSVKDEINNATSSPADLTVTDNWAVGKWGCGNDVVYSSKISTNFSRPIDSSNMTISFRYRSGGDYPRLVLRWSDNASSTSTWTLGNNYTNFDGLPGVWGNYPFDFPFDSTWRQATLVINQAQHYWSIYVDGQEKFHQPFADFMPLARSLSVYTTNGPSVIDELAIWDRALPQAEILAINNFNAPFWPLVGREAPLAPVLTHAWHFDEGTGVANDSVGTAAITIPDGAWSYSGKVNHSVSILWSKDLTLSFAPLNNSKDLSFAFWYQAREYPNEGRIRFALRKGNQELMSLIPSVYRTKYVFNGREEIWSESLNNFLPYDDAWHHLAMTYDSYNYVLRVYIDGKEMASSSQIWLKDGTAPDNLLIKEENGSANIDELGLWQGALSTMQIKDIYDREK